MLLDERNIELTSDQAALQWLDDAGYDPLYSSQTAKRLIRWALQNPFAKRSWGGSSDNSSITVRGIAD